MRKTMNTRIDHARMRIKTLNKERSKWERGIPWHRTINALSRERVSTPLKNNLMYVIEQNKSIMYDNQIHQTINRNHVCRASTKACLFLHGLIP